MTYTYTRKDGSKGRSIQVSISQSGTGGRDVLERFNAATGGIGRIYGPYPPAKNQTLVRNIYEATGFWKVQEIAALLWSYLSEPKQQQFVKTLGLHC